MAVASSEWGKDIEGVAIEACKSWGAFKTRSNKIKTLVEKAVPGTKVVINAEKPRKGTFEIVANGEVVLSLVGMARPFKAMKSKDMEEVAEQVVAALSGGSSASSKAAAKKPAKKASTKKKPAAKKASAKKKASTKKPASKRKAPAKKGSAKKKNKK